MDRISQSEDLRRHILSFLLGPAGKEMAFGRKNVLCVDNQSLMAMACTSRAWKQAVYDPRLWNISTTKGNLNHHPGSSFFFCEQDGRSVQPIGFVHVADVSTAKKKEGRGIFSYYHVREHATQKFFRVVDMEFPHASDNKETSLLLKRYLQQAFREVWVSSFAQEPQACNPVCLSILSRKRNRMLFRRAYSAETQKSLALEMTDSFKGHLEILSNMEGSRKIQKQHRDEVLRHYGELEGLPMPQYATISTEQIESSLSKYTGLMDWVMEVAIVLDWELGTVHRTALQLKQLILLDVGFCGSRKLQATTAALIFISRSLLGNGYQLISGSNKKITSAIVETDSSTLEDLVFSMDNHYSANTIMELAIHLLMKYSDSSTHEINLNHPTLEHWISLYSKDNWTVATDFAVGESRIGRVAQGLGFLLIPSALYMEVHSLRHLAACCVVLARWTQICHNSQGSDEDKRQPSFTSDLMWNSNKDDPHVTWEDALNPLLPQVLQTIQQQYQERLLWSSSSSFPFSWEFLGWAIDEALPQRWPPEPLRAAAERGAESNFVMRGHSIT